MQSKEGDHEVQDNTEEPIKILENNENDDQQS